MSAKDRLDHRDVKAVAVAYRDALRAHQDRLNRLNVYPVPDGDTGTNMALTLESVVERLHGATDMAETCGAIANGTPRSTPRWSAPLWWRRARLPIRR